MRSTRRAGFGLLAVVAATCLIGVGCQTPPVGQAVPPGGRVIATTAPGSYIELETASGDLSRLVYEQGSYSQFFAENSGGSYQLYDEATGTTTQLPFPRRAYETGVSLSADGRTLVFASPDPSLQDGPVPLNCRDYNGFFQPMTPTYCTELYRYDIDTGAVQQMTGLDAPSNFHNSRPNVSADGSTVEFTISSLIPESGSALARLDLATGEIEELPYSHVLEWDRGDTIVSWTSYLFRLAATDVASGQVTLLPAPLNATYESSAANGRYIVFSGTGGRHLVDTVEVTMRTIPGTWVDDTATSSLLVQNNVAPSGGGRVIVAPLDP